MVRWQGAALLILVVALAMVLLHVHAKLVWLRELPTKNLAAVYGALRTGDVVLFVQPSPSVVFQAVSVFTHVGVVVDNGNAGKQVLETHMPGDTRHMGFDTSGVNMYDLRQRVATYDGTIFILRLRPEVKARTSVILSKYAKIPYYDTYMMHHALHCLPQALFGTWGTRQSDPTRMHCAMLVGLVLRDLGVMSPSSTIECLTPESFAHMPRAFGELFRVV